MNAQEAGEVAYKAVTGHNFTRPIQPSMAPYFYRSWSIFRVLRARAEHLGTHPEMVAAYAASKHPHDLLAFVVAAATMSPADLTEFISCT